MIKYLFIILLMMLSSTAIATDYVNSKGIMSPLVSERLDNPIYLNNYCNNVSIIEWRGTESTKESIDNIRKICNLAVSKFEVFIKNQKGYEIRGKIVDFETNLCLMPLNSFPRNLNDMKYRFAERPGKFAVWGYFHRSPNNIYIRNDVILNGKNNRNFEVVLAHELFHALSYKYKIYEQHPGNKDQVEEFMAQKFTLFLGLGK